MIELVLPSGKFATVRPVLWRDFALARTALVQHPALDLDTLLIVSCVQIDGEAVDYGQVLEMDARDVINLTRHIAALLTGPVTA